MFVPVNVCFLTDSMKNKIAFFVFVFLFLSCNNGAIEKPKNLIDRNKMVNILYDVTLLDAIKNQNINGGINFKAANDYIYKKYSIDSLQFVESNKYYASDMDEYKKMFEEIQVRLDKEIQSLEAEMKKKGETIAPEINSTFNSGMPQVQ